MRPAYNQKLFDLAKSYEHNKDIQFDVCYPLHFEHILLPKIDDFELAIEDIDPNDIAIGIYMYAFYVSKEGEPWWKIGTSTNIFETYLEELDKWDVVKFLDVKKISNYDQEKEFHKDNCVNQHMYGDDDMVYKAKLPIITSFYKVGEEKKSSGWKNVWKSLFS